MLDYNMFDFDVRCVMRVCGVWKYLNRTKIIGHPLQNTFLAPCSSVCLSVCVWAVSSCTIFKFNRLAVPSRSNNVQAMYVYAPKSIQLTHNIQRTLSTYLSYRISLFLAILLLLLLHVCVCVCAGFIYTSTHVGIMRENYIWHSLAVAQPYSDNVAVGSGQNATQTCWRCWE